MPDYIIKVKTPLTLFQQDLDRLEDAVYDVLVGLNSPTEVDADGVGLTDVDASYN